MKEDILEKKTYYAAKKSASLTEEKHQGHTASRIKILQGKRDNISRLKEEALKNKEKLYSSLKSVESQEDKMQKDYEDLLEEVEGLRDEYNRKREEYTKLKLSASSHEEKINDLGPQIEDIRVQISREEEKIYHNTRRIGELLRRDWQDYRGVICLKS